MGRGLFPVFSPGAFFWVVALGVVSPSFFGSFCWSGLLRSEGHWPSLESWWVLALLLAYGEGWGGCGRPGGSLALVASFGLGFVRGLVFV